ncbi:hypothetical protein [Nocardia sp. NPDC004123]
MRPIDSGVIDALRPADPDTSARGADNVSVIGAIPDLPLGTLPADMPPFQPPEFMLARKEFEQVSSPLAGPGGAAAESRTGTFGATVAPALHGAHDALSGAQDALGSAEAVPGSADAAPNAVAAALNAAQTAPTRAAADPAAALPPLPADPVGDLVKGLALPAIPGLDTLFEPFLDLLQSFGTGILGRLNPATLLNTGSRVIEAAIQIGGGALETVESLWQGQASQRAQESGRQAGNHGRETAQRGFDLSSITTQAAAVVQRGNIQLTAIAEAFAAEATALAPLILTPIGQTTLIASATRHLGEAVAVVNATRGELSVYTAQVHGIIGQLIGQGGGPNPAEFAQSLAQNVGRPILEQAKSLFESGLQDATRMPGAPRKSDPVSGLPNTTAAGTGGIGARVGGLGGGPPSPPGAPGSSIPGGKVTNPANPFGAGAADIPGLGGPAGPGFMGSRAAAGTGQGDVADAKHGRTVRPHQSHTAESELTGNLGTFAPGVIGEPAASTDAAETDPA